MKLKKINSSAGAFSSAARTSLGFAISMAALFFALGLGRWFDAASAAATQQRKAFLIGVVLPRHASPGNRISGSLVANPDDSAQDPRLIVEHVTLTLPADDAGRPILNDAFVDAGDGRQSAAARFTARVPADGSRIRVACGDINAPEQARHLDVPMQPPSANVKASSRGYSMLPIESDSGVMAINGSYDGDSAYTQVTVNGKPAAVVAESPDAAYFAVGDASHKGRNRVVLKQHGQTTSFDMFEAEVSIAADRTALKEHESAHFKVTVDGLQEMPAADWRAGNPADLYDTASALENARDFTPPTSGAGVVMLTIANRSTETVTMTPANSYSVPLTRVDLERGPKVVEGKVTALQAGRFTLDASLVPLLADSPGVEKPGGPGELARAENTPTPHSEQTPIARSEEKQTPRTEETPTEHRDYGPPVVLVPGVPQVPLIAPPKCCVISSLTVTNNESYPVFFVINGRYRAGMAPPLDQWVQPGKSVTFKGDLGVCVRIESFNDRSFDEDGNPLTGLFDDETVCCKDLVSGKKKGRRFSYTIDSVEWREWRDCPETPPKIGGPPKIVIQATRTRTPTPTRTRTPTPTATETETPTPTATDTPNEPAVEETPIGVTPPPEADECPQRGRGCAALVIDLFKAELARKVNDIQSDPTASAYLKDAYKHIYHDHLDDAVQRLREMKCKIVESYPDFWRHPEPFTIKLPGATPMTIAPVKEVVDLVIQHNKDEWRKLNAADLEHQTDLVKEWEIVFEIVAAHGGPRYTFADKYACGSWGQDFDADGDLFRWPFHQDHYRALKYRVCDWVVYDSSCYSGLTPQAIDGLENANHDRCTGEPTVNCNAHAAYEGDLATGTAPSTDTCIGGHTFEHFDSLYGALNMPIDKSGPYGGSVLDNLADVLGATPPTPRPTMPQKYQYRPSYYRDKGYHGDRPPPVEHPRKYLYATMTATLTPTATPTP